MSLIKSKSQVIRPRKVKDLLQMLQNPPLPPVSKKNQVVIDVEEVKKSMKKSWRGSGFANGEFNRLEVMKGKTLTNWEISRMSLSKRSYSSPKQSQGFRYDPYSRELKIKDEKNMYSKQFLKHLSTLQQSYQNKLFQVASNKNQTKTLIARLTTSTMKFPLKNTLFGCPQTSGSRTITSFGSQQLKSS